ncbi:P-loop containing nucleoside triphosphate hydrolase protein [Mycena capillaripes]|nr:P-loop containing nucleoside triphosphate hydrolase protein [Mycena capillaripes]
MPLLIRVVCEYSSGSLSLLPASPKIFYGRESELEALISTLLADPARAVILGPGGMGKTTLAMAALHHSSIVQKYSVRHFISCESTNTAVDLVTTIGLHLGLERSTQLSQAIVKDFGACGPCLIVLDNFETPWDTLEFRGRVEEFISLLADIPTLALLASITMRGAERPSKVKWTRPFLPPLEPLSPSASRQIFSDVADYPIGEEEEVLATLVDLSGSLPLAVSLMANIASFEGYSGTLALWETENTALLSDGHDKRSNLEKSITLSLGSPRIASSPHAKKVLALLSLLPDGITAEDIQAANVSVPDFHQCRSALLRTSLAYTDVRGRLKALSPIRAFIRHAHPPALPLARPLRTYFLDLLALWRSNHLHLPSGALAPRLLSHLGNINELILDGLSREDKSARVAIGYSIIVLDRFSTVMLKGNSPLFQRLPKLIEETDDAGLRWRYANACLRHHDVFRLKGDPEVLIYEGIQYFHAGGRDDFKQGNTYFSCTV